MPEAHQLVLIQNIRKIVSWIFLEPGRSGYPVVNSILLFAVIVTGILRTGGARECRRSVFSILSSLLRNLE